MTKTAQKTTTAKPNQRVSPKLAQPLARKSSPFLPKNYRYIGQPGSDLSGRVSEAVARFLGTPAFIFWLTIVCVVWLAWNTLMPEELRFDSPDLGFTALTLILSLQASYAAPLILLAQNRQTDRDRVAMEHDRNRAERNLADTEYLAREIASVRVSLSELAADTVSRDFVRQELKSLLAELKAEERDIHPDDKRDKPKISTDTK